MQAGVPGDHVGHGVDEADDPLGHRVAGGRLGAEQVGAGGEVEVGVGLHALVEVDDVQYVEQLPLVLMQPLHLHVKEGVGVEDDAALPGHPGGEGLLIVRLDLPQAGEHARVVPVLLQLLEGVGLEQVFVLAAAVADQASSSGLHSLSQRRWSMPLVTLVNLSGVRA